MTKRVPEEVEKKSMVLWQAVVEALLNLMQHHREQLSRLPGPNDEWYLGAMRRAALTLALFVDPQRD